MFSHVAPILFRRTRTVGSGQKCDLLVLSEIDITMLLEGAHLSKGWFESLLLYCLLIYLGILTKIEQVLLEYSVGLSSIGVGY